MRPKLTVNWERNTGWLQEIVLISYHILIHKVSSRLLEFIQKLEKLNHLPTCKNFIIFVQI